MKPSRLHLTPPADLFSAPLVHTGIAGLWLALFWPCIQWLVETYGQAEFRLNGLLFVFILAMLGRRLFTTNELPLSFSPKSIPVTVLAFGLAAYLAIERFWDIDILSCMAFGTATFGLLGLYLPASVWKRCAPGTLLLVATLPFGQHLEIFLGFPLRILSAQVVHTVFGLMGIDSVSQESIVLIENRLTHIDLPCSGIKSLWTGGVFYLFMTVMEGYRLGLRWLAGLIALLSLIVSANLVRIFLLVSLSHGNVSTTLTRAVHVPLGLLGFGLACGLVSLCCSRWVPRFEKEPVRFLPPAHPAQGWVLFLILGFSLWAHEGRLPASSAPANRSLLSFPRATALPLTPVEREFFSLHAGVAVQKLRFDFEGLRGTLFLARTAHWRAHHHPEQCLAGQGHAIDHSRTRFISADFPYRQVALNPGGYRAAYWFYSKGEVTDDYTARIWSGLREPHREWTLVTLTFDREIGADSAAAKRLMVFLRDRLAQSNVSNEKGTS